MPLVRSIDYHDPYMAFHSFAEDECAALFAHMGRAKNGMRCVLLAADPTDVIQHAQADSRNTFFDRLRTYIAQTGSSNNLLWPGGLIGYFGYELANEIERYPAPRPDTCASFPLAFLGLYEAVALFDTKNFKAWVAGCGPHAEQRMEALAARLSGAHRSCLPKTSNPFPGHPLSSHVFPPWECELTRADYEHRLAQVIDYIHAGDIFQANLSQRFLARKPRGVSDYDLFLRLMARSPAPYSAFLRCGDVSLASASPELFLRSDTHGHVVTHPIKGTRPRGRDPVEDFALASSLRNSAKDHAENLMIVDVMRNDLARACKVGSVCVPKLCEVERFSSVHHLVSEVEGDLRAGMGAADLLRACFPGASISGAPKIRAMEIIRELETAPRGPYCGCYGIMRFDGAMELAMTIRTLAIHKDTVIAQAGGGIVADSLPADEYDETLVKAAPLLDSLADWW